MTEETKIVTLGRKEFRVDELVLGQTKKLFGKFSALQNLDANTVGEDQINKMVEIVLIGLSRAHPDLTAETLDNLPIKPSELTNVINVIAQQAGLAVVALGESVPAAPAMSTN